jgi:hypothetical protein
VEIIIKSENEGVLRKEGICECDLGEKETVDGL